MDNSAVRSSKKRKHAITSDVAASSMTTAKITISDDNGRDTLRPLITSCPAIALPSDSLLSLYTENGTVSAKSASSDKGKGRVSSMLQGECGPLDWHSSNRLFGTQSGGNLEQLDDVFGATGNEDGGCSAAYALALYDPQKQSVSLISTPLHIMQHIPKRLKTLSALAASSDPVASNAAARTALGMEFGTKKAKKAILAVQRNKIDAGAQDLQEVQDVIMETLDQGLTTLPQTSPAKLAGPGASSTIDIDAYVENARNTGMPVPDTDASKPHAVYAIHGSVIFEKEWEVINPTYLIKSSKEDIAALLGKLPHYSSTWINDRVKHLLTSPEIQSKDRKKKLKYLLWLAALLSVKGIKGSIDVADDESMRKRFGRGQTLVPLDCVRSLLERFGESVRGTTNYSFTPSSISRLNMHFLVIALHVDGYGPLDITTLASDLGVPARRAADYLRALGAHIVTPRGAELERVIATWRTENKSVPIDLTGGKVRTATLKIPLDFPREKKTVKAVAKR